jgi:hypothetical protein
VLVATSCSHWRIPDALLSCHRYGEILPPVQSNLATCQIQRSAAARRFRSEQTGSKVRIDRHSPAIVLSGDNLRCPVLGTEKNSMVLPRRIQLEDAQRRPVETGSQLGHGDRKNNFVDLDGAK